MKKEDQRIRRKFAKERLEAQLASGEKTKKKTKNKKVPLTDYDKKRIKKELDTLSKRV